MPPAVARTPDPPTLTCVVFVRSAVTITHLHASDARIASAVPGGATVLRPSVSVVATSPELDGDRRQRAVGTVRKLERLRVCREP
jgi:hypothetical protein